MRKHPPCRTVRASRVSRSSDGHFADLAKCDQSRAFRSKEIAQDLVGHEQPFVAKPDQPPVVFE
jgi:hypothetical protein